MGCFAVAVHTFLPAGIGDFSVWEFSGTPVYFCCYDYFAANDATSIHVIVFSLEEPYEIQLNQVIFWLSFLKSLVPVEEPIGELSPGWNEAFLLCLWPLRLQPSQWLRADPAGWAHCCGFLLSPSGLETPTLRHFLFKPCEVQGNFCLWFHAWKAQSGTFLDSHFSPPCCTLALRSSLLGAQWGPSMAPMPFGKVQGIH